MLSVNEIIEFHRQVQMSGYLSKNSVHGAVLMEQASNTARLPGLNVMKSSSSAVT